MRRAPARPVRACFVRSCCTDVVQEHDLRTAPAQSNAKQTLSSHFTVHASHPALRTSHLHFSLDTSSHLKSGELFSPHLSSSHLIPFLLTCHLSKFFSTVFISSEHWSTFLISSKFASTHLSCSARQQAFTVREKSLAHTHTHKPLGAESFCTQKLETQMHLHRKASPKYFEPQSLHEALPSTILPYKACTKHFPVLLCTTKLAQSTSQYYFVLQSWHKTRSRTTMYFKACTKHFPVLLCATNLPQSTSQYNFVLQAICCFVTRSPRRVRRRTKRLERRPKP